MVIRTSTVILLALLYSGSASALEPHEILVIANKDRTESVRIARYYCRKRGVPDKNILALPLGTNLHETISRDNYEKQLAEPNRPYQRRRNKRFGRQRVVNGLVRRL